MHWTMILNTDGIMKLYATFPSISRLEAAEKQRILEELGRIADDKFDGRIELLLVTSLYTAQRQ